MQLFSPVKGSDCCVRLKIILSIKNIAGKEVLGLFPEPCLSGASLWDYLSNLELLDSHPPTAVCLLFPSSFCQLSTFNCQLLLNCGGTKSSAIPSVGVRLPSGKHLYPWPNWKTRESAAKLLPVGGGARTPTPIRSRLELRASLPLHLWSLGV